MNPNSKKNLRYSAICQWLTSADDKYIGGRALWFQWLYTSACIPLWLGVEQMMKTVILLERYLVDSEGQTEEELYHWLQRRARKLNHDADTLIAKVSEVAGIDHTPYAESIKKVHEFFERRYPARGGTSLNPAILDDIDEYYFLLRDRIPREVHPAFIDTIALKLESGRKHPLRATDFAFIKNKSFRRRELIIYNQLVEGKVMPVQRFPSKEFNFE